MIECECCDNYFHPDDIRKCPNCETELCPECYDIHVKKCLNNDDCDCNNDYVWAFIPRLCPDCDTELDTDIDSDEVGRVFCPECSYVLELTKEQISELISEEESDDYEEESEEYDGNDAFTCPDCGRTFAPDDYENGDAGNGFCAQCASEH